MDGYVSRYKNESATEKSITVPTQRREFVRQVEFMGKVGSCPTA